MALLKHTAKIPSRREVKIAPTWLIKPPPLAYKTSYLTYKTSCLAYKTSCLAYKTSLLYLRYFCSSSSYGTLQILFKYFKYHKLGDGPAKKAFKYKKRAADRENNKRGKFIIAQIVIALFYYLILFLQ